MKTHTKFYTVQIDKCGTTRYYNKRGQLHNENGPAEVYENGNKASKWYKNGKLHREDGPAVEYANGIKKWYLNDKQYTETQFNKKSGKIVKHTMAEVNKKFGYKVIIVKSH